MFIVKCLKPPELLVVFVVKMKILLDIDYLSMAKLIKRGTCMIKKLSLICLSFVLMQVFCCAMTYAKYATSKSVATINLTINAKTQEYEVPETVNNKEVYVRKTFTDGEILEMENIKTSNNLGDNFKITENGLHIMDDSTTTGYWIYIQYLAEDGYSSTLVTDHVYYARAEVNILSIETDSYFSFGFYNESHENGHFGVASTSKRLSASTNGSYVLMSIHGKPQTRNDYTHQNGTVFKGDYPDTLQFGSCALCVQECYVKNIMMLDLTQIFGVGNEPPKSWCDENITIETAQIEWIVDIEP